MSDSGTHGHRWIIEAEIMPKRGVNDPHGEAVMSGLKSLAFANTQRVRVGKLIRIEVAAQSEADAVDQGNRMCETLLANPVIEDFVVSVAQIG
jgi:phosphoribosylformylglycinamidine synthase